MNTWFAILLALQMGDVLTTLYALHHGGIEANRWLAKLMTEYDAELVLLGAKVLFIGLVSVAMEFKVLPLWALQALCAGYALLLAWNGYQIARLVR